MLRIALLAFVALCLPLAESPGDAHSAPPAYDFTAVTNLVQSTVTDQGLDGASLMLIKDGQPIYEEYFGSYTATTVVPIASSTKWLSAGAFMTLVDDGLIALDDPVSLYLPEWTGQMGAITMRQLWSFTSGLVDNHACMDDTTTTLANCVEQIRLAGLVAPPGSEFYYGGASMMVAGRVAEVATGQSWSQLYVDRMRTPMGFTFTGYGLTANPRISGGAFSHLHDYASLLQMYLDGGTYESNVILAPSTVKEMQEDQTFGVPIAYSPHPDGARYGIGEWRDIVDSGENAVQLSSQGKFGFSPWIDNQRGYLGVFLVNDLLFPNLYPVVDQLQEMIRTELDTFDTDGDGAQDSADTDDDNDGGADSFERACGTVSADPAITQPERIDGPFAAVDDDGDGLIDELLPGYSYTHDCDGDGYKGSAEDHVFSYLPQTNGDQKTCQQYDASFQNPTHKPSLRWPADLNGSTFSLNKVNINDLAAFINPIRYLNQDVGTDPMDVRFDLVPGSTVGADINIADLAALTSGAGGFPPMLGGAKAFNGPVCPWAP